MAEVEIAPASFGGELKDGFKPVNAWVGGGIAWLEDIQTFYRERSVIEREYSTKLSALAKRFHEKKARKTSVLSVGDTPTLTPGSLESASLTTWTTQLQTVESRASEHERYAVELISQVAEPLRVLGARYEEIRKRHADYAATLERERDASYAELKKMKTTYDGVCQDVENKRKKTDSSFDHGKGKAHNAYQQQLSEMNNVKNSYLISINVTNRQKEKYYHEYVPEVLDSLQDLSETRTAKLNSLWMLAGKLEKGMLNRSADHLQYMCDEIPRNDPHLDSMMFVKHNAGNWHEPGDMSFVPSPVWHDDDRMAVDELARTFLRNVMGRSKGQLTELKRDTDKKRREVDGVRRIRASVRQGKDNSRDEAEVVRSVLALQEELHSLERKRITAEVETTTIQAAVGDLTQGAKNHKFRSQTFKIPTNCDLCGDRIWGLSAKGLDCTDCGYTCHGKCELKTPPTCPGEQTKEEKKKLKNERQESARAAHPVSNGAADHHHHTPPSSTPVESVAPSLSRSNTMNSLSSGYAASAHRSVSGPAPGAGGRHSDESSPERSATVKATPAPAQGRKNRVVAPPPSQYVKESPPEDDSPGGGAALLSPTRPAQSHGKMIYPYDASGADEISIDDGREVVIVEPDDGSGWIKIRAGRDEGLVPASYVEVTAQSDRPTSTYSGSSVSLASSATGAGGGGKKKVGPAVAPKRGAKKLQYVEALYDYTARTDSEWSISEGERFILVNRDAGNGWADVERGGVTKSVPANYIHDVT